MSKSYNNYIALTDSGTILQKKVQKIETDTVPLGTPKNPDECNVYNIMKYFIDPATDATLREKYLTGNYTYKELKALCYESISTFLQPIQNNLHQISDSDIQSILDT